MNTAILHELPQAAYTSVGSEVYRGLTARPKTLSPWLFYDREGSQLFEEITALEEYYLTRTERAIFEQHADVIIAAASRGLMGKATDGPTPIPSKAPSNGPSTRFAAPSTPITVIELGAGTATKTGILLAAAVRKQGSVEYHAIDVSESALAEAKQNIEEHVAGVTVVTQTADYTDGLGSVETPGRRRLVLYIGSSIGNFDASGQLEVLRGVRSQLRAGDRLLLGMDMVKDLPSLLAAYDDSKGVTAAFNKNVLARINRELGADFHPKCFRHKVRWDGDLSRIEMHLESLVRQKVTIPALGLEVALRRGETIHTENSYKFTAERIAEMLKKTGFRMTDRWMDEKEWFSVVLAEAA